jgi:hypothetical protein
MGKLAGHTFWKRHTPSPGRFSPCSFPPSIPPIPGAWRESHIAIDRALDLDQIGWNLRQHRLSPEDLLGKAAGPIPEQAFPFH